MIRKTTLSAIQLESIQRFCSENDAVPMLSIFPNQVNFRIKTSGVQVTKTLAELVYHHTVAKEEEKNMRNDEKKRKEREEKWTPRKY